MESNKIVVFTGAGISAESGLQTFRDSDGLWNNYSVYEVATPQAWKRNPKLVLDFYNERRKNACAASPNKAHKAIAELQEKFDVVVITQNVDNLHERAGSKMVIHIHGELVKARSTSNSELIYDISDRPINLGDSCEHGSQLRPHIVWFGEQVINYELASQFIQSAGKILVVGTSLSVYPAAQLLEDADVSADKIIVSLDVEDKPYNYKLIQEKATVMVPHVVDCWMNGRQV